MSTSPRRHRGPSRGRWLPVIVSVLLGAALGAGGMAAARSGLGSPAPPATAQPSAPSSVPAPSSTPVQPAETAPSVKSVAFAEPAINAAGMSLTVLRPEKVKGGVRLTIALANNTNAPIVVNTNELGPHDPTFNGAPVPITITPARKNLVPGEGYTYQCVITLPTMNVGQLAFVVDALTVTGQAAGD